MYEKTIHIAVFVNAHHSIGARALLLFGTKEQQARWLPGLLDGSKLCAFALTEPEAGSDAGNVQTSARPTEDGQAYILNGTKHYITNGGIADLLTVMARTPAPIECSKLSPTECQSPAAVAGSDLSAVALAKADDPGRLSGGTART